MGHNTVGMYQNGRIVHGGSGGNGMITLDSSIGNELSHEVGHNYGLGHYVDGFNGSVHRSADKINSSWGWDSQKNLFIPNFASVNTGQDQCLDEQCQPPFMGKYKYGKDSMAGGSPNWGSNRFTLYTPNTSRIIQKFLEGKAIWDPSSSTGFRKYDPLSKQMKEYVNNANNQKVPRLFRVPVTTLVGYYDPSPTRGLGDYIYPALHGAYGFVYNEDGGSSTGTANGCELVVKTSSGPLVYTLSTTIYSNNDMNKFHVNIATEDEPSEALIYCYNEVRASLTLNGPNENEPPLTYTVNGVQWDNHSTKPPSDSPTTSPTDSPTASPTNSPTAPPTPVPISSPVSPPTSAPVSPPTGTSAPVITPEGCYSIDNKDCLPAGYDSISCIKIWLPNGAKNDCVALGGECTSNQSTCCEPAECVGDNNYSACLSLPEATSDPTKAPTEASFPPSPSCTICDDEPTNGMKKKGRSCTDIILKKKCNKNASWIKKGYCQLSCYNEGLGYEGDVCCTDTSIVDEE